MVGADVGADVVGENEGASVAKLWAYLSALRRRSVESS
jgi:hypothetical protein